MPGNNLLRSLAPARAFTLTLPTGGRLILVDAATGCPVEVRVRDIDCRGPDTDPLTYRPPKK
jgi:hypothetical protein